MTIEQNVEREVERLSEEELGNLLASIGNSEAKAITLLAMVDGEIYTRWQLHNALKEMQGGYSGWLIDSLVSYNYCHLSFCQIGLVAEEALKPDLSTFGYIKTEYGKLVGTPLAGLLLEFSEKYPEISLYKLFGSTVSGAKSFQIETLNKETIDFRKRAPLTRLKILRTLLEEKSPIRAIDLGQKIAQNRSYVLPHIKELVRSNIISYESIDREKGLSFYRLLAKENNDLPKQYASQRTLTQKVYQVCKARANEWLTTRDVIRDLDVAEERKKKMKGTVSSILVHFKTQGYLESKEFGRLLRSKVYLSEEQKSRIIDLLEILDRFADRDPEIITRGVNFANKIIKTPLRISNLLRKAKENSRWVGSMRTEELEIVVYSAFSGSSEMDTKSIQNILARRFNKTLSIERVEQVLRIMEKKHRVCISRKIQHGANYWKIIDK